MGKAHAEAVAAAHERACRFRREPAHVGAHGERGGNLRGLTGKVDGVASSFAGLADAACSLGEVVLVGVGAGAVGSGEHSERVGAGAVDVDGLEQELSSLGDYRVRPLVGREGQLVVDEVRRPCHEAKRAIGIGLREAVPLLTVAPAKVGHRTGGRERVAVVERGGKPKPQSLEVLCMRVKRHVPPFRPFHGSEGGGHHGGVAVCDGLICAAVRYPSHISSNIVAWFIHDNCHYGHIITELYLA